jgi:hypothetical protein
MRYYNKLLILAILASTFNGCNSSSTTDETTTQPTTVESKSLEPSGWYMRVIVQATDENDKVYIHNSAGVFGELDESLDGLDKHDIPAKGSAVLQVRFVNDNLDNTQGYYSDYRSYDNNKTKESWDIVVINDDSNVDLSNAPIQLEIEAQKDIYRKANGLYTETPSPDKTKLDNLKIIDLDNQVVYSYNDLKNANLSMDGKKERKFRLILGNIKQDDKVSFETKNILTKSYKIQTPTKGFGLPPE